MSNVPVLADRSVLENAGVNGFPSIELPFRFEAPVGLTGVQVLADVQVGRHSYMTGGMIRQSVTIGRYCSIGRNVLIAAADHPLDGLTTHPISWQARSRPRRPDQSVRQPRHPRTILGHDVWVGDNVVILAGVHIGTGCAIGANAVVTRDVPPYTIVGGVPARVIRPRFSEDIIAGLLATEWWTLPTEALKALDMNDVEACIREIPGLRDLFGTDAIDIQSISAT